MFALATAILFSSRTIPAMVVVPLLPFPEESELLSSFLHPANTMMHKRNKQESFLIRFCVDE
jgi:hypothetical protein